MQSLSSYFHDAIRPKIIRENSVYVLADLCDIFLAQVSQRVSKDEDEILAYQGALITILEDVQQRFIFRCQAFVQTEIQSYIPKPEDLNYPDRLIVTSSPSSSTSSRSSSHNNLQSALSKSLIFAKNHSSLVLLRFTEKYFFLSFASLFHILI